MNANEEYKLVIRFVNWQNNRNSNLSFDLGENLLNAKHNYFFVAGLSTLFFAWNYVSRYAI